MNNWNNLNIPPDHESWQRKVCRLATQFIIPVILPASTAFVVWLGHRKSLGTESSTPAKLTSNREVQTEKEAVNHTANAQVLEAKRLNLYLKERLKYEQQVQVEEEKELQGILEDLKYVRKMMVSRQDIYCSTWTPREGRKRIEKDLLVYTYNKHYDKELSFYPGMLKVLDARHGDTHCGSSKAENGSLMWEWLDGMEAKAHVRKYQRIHIRMKDWEMQYTKSGKFTLLNQAFDHM
ncbi:uncharacterized protein LOC144445074 [Glandiceps talaboti]